MRRGFRRLLARPLLIHEAGGFSGTKQLLKCDAQEKGEGENVVDNSSGTCGLVVTRVSRWHRRQFDSHTACGGARGLGH